uniref:Uncharacterized protein n=1 Tax=Loxodonta africana TaxID=9785 RepID=G3U1L7_LOXAF
CMVTPRTRLELFFFLNSNLLSDAGHSHKVVGNFVETITNSTSLTFSL